MCKRPPIPGRRIRLDVSSPNLIPTPGEAIGRERRRVVADNTVFHEWGRESRVAYERDSDRPETSYAREG